MPKVQFRANGAIARGYLAIPAERPTPATVVLQESWGVDDHIRSVCDRFAAEGFLALAPDLYRGDVTSRPSEAEQKMMALSMDQAAKDIDGAAAYLTAHEGFRGPGVGTPQARLRRDPSCRPRAFRNARRARLGRGRTSARGSTARRGRPRAFRALPRRGTRVLQRHQPARHLRRAGGRTVVAEHDRVPPPGARALTAPAFVPYKMIRLTATHATGTEEQR
jgi:Dienelactone hydrolase family